MARQGKLYIVRRWRGAVILEASKNDSWVPVLHADGRQSQALTLKSRHDANWLFEKEHPDLFKRDYFISMDGRAIFQFAVRKVPEVIDELLEKNNLKKKRLHIIFFIRQIAAL